jgi:hypothetical protein
LHWRNANFSLEMKLKLSFSFCFTPLFTLVAAAGLSQTATAPDRAGTSPAREYPAQGTIASAAILPQGAVSYSSVTQLDDLLIQIENISKAAQLDLAQLRVERWKTDGATKRQALADVDSIQRNLQKALPEMIGHLHSSPEDLPATFKLYRNMDALYDVMGGLVESAGAFGPKDDFQSLSNDLSGFENSRKQLAERLETLAGAKEQEIVRLRTELKKAEAAAPPAAPPKKVIVDDTEPEKKPVAKKPAAKKKTPAKKPAPTPAPNATQNPPAEAKPQ